MSTTDGPIDPKPIPPEWIQNEEMAMERLKAALEAGDVKAGAQALADLIDARTLITVTRQLGWYQ